MRSAAEPQRLFVMSYRASSTKLYRPAAIAPPGSTAINITRTDASATASRLIFIPCRPFYLFIFPAGEDPSVGSALGYPNRTVMIAHPHGSRYPDIDQFAITNCRILTFLDAVLSKRLVSANMIR